MAAEESGVGKVQAFLKDSRVTDALKSEQAESVSDKILDAAANAANKVTGNKFESQIEQARQAADKNIGTE